MIRGCLILAFVTAPATVWMDGPCLLRPAAPLPGMRVTSRLCDAVPVLRALRRIPLALRRSTAGEMARLGDREAVALELRATSDTLDPPLLLQQAARFEEICTGLIADRDGVVLDHLSASCWSFERWRTLRGRPLFERLIQVHAVTGPNETFFHTHGMVKLASPDLELRVPPGVDVDAFGRILTQLGRHLVEKRLCLRPSESVLSPVGDIELGVRSRTAGDPHYGGNEVVSLELRTGWELFRAGDGPGTPEILRKEYFYGHAS